MNDLARKGSKTAKDGFANENDVVSKFNNWQSDEFAKEWLQAMNYSLRTCLISFEENSDETKLGHGK